MDSNNTKTAAVENEDTTTMASDESSTAEAVDDGVTKNLTSEGRDLDRATENATSEKRDLEGATENEALCEERDLGRASKNAVICDEEASSIDDLLDKMDGVREQLAVGSTDKIEEMDASCDKAKEEEEKAADTEKVDELLDVEPTAEDGVAEEATADEENAQGNDKKSRPTPESIALDRNIQNVTRKAYKNAKGGDKKLVELLVHVFDNCGTSEEKMEALAKKYVQLAADQKDIEQKMNEFESKYNKIRKERDHLQGEYNKLLIAKGKLESLCRELQKHNKSIKEETQRRADEEDRKRKELSQKFQATISDITQQMADNHKRNQQLKQDNNDLAQKLKGLVEQYEVREQHIEKVLKAKQLELQLCEAKLQQQSLIMQEEVETNLKEKHMVLEESLIYKKKCEELLRQEAELRAQLSLYTEKFEEFQSTLTKSNEVFGTFKKDMDTMTKTIRKLEKESHQWKSRWENTNRSLLQMVDERTENQTTITNLNKKIDKLENLCRALQARGQPKTSEKDDSSASSPTRVSPRSPKSSPKKSPSPPPPTTAIVAVDIASSSNCCLATKTHTNQPSETNEAAETDERMDASFATPQSPVPLIGGTTEEKPSGDCGGEGAGDEAPAVEAANEISCAENGGTPVESNDETESSTLSCGDAGNSGGAAGNSVEVADDVVSDSAEPPSDSTEESVQSNPLATESET